MSAVSSISNTNPVRTYQAQSTAVQSKPVKTETPQDSVQLSKTAQAALSGGDVDHDGDSH